MSRRRSSDEARRPRRPRRSGRQRAVIALGVLVTIGCIAAVAFVVYEAAKIGGIERTDVALAQASEAEPQNWLLVGSDSRDMMSKSDPNGAVFTGGGEAPSGQRSDTIMIVRVDPKGEHLDILSLQRDLWLNIARTGGEERINTAYTYDDGPQRLIDTIRDDLGIEINHYAEINFESFQGIVDAVGGVPMYFDKPMLDDNSGLAIMKTGCVNLDGYQALAFARSRHLRYSDGLHWIDDPSGDLGRISRQQYFMRRMFDRAASKALSSPQTFNELVDVARKYVKLDDELEITKLVNMAQQFGTFQGDSIRTYTLPTSPWTTPGGAAVLKLDAEGAEPILNRFKGIPDGDLPPSQVSFTVENGSGVTGQAAEVQKAFQAIGYDASGAKDSPTKVDRTVVRYAPGSRATADQIARHLTAGADLQVDSSLAPGAIVLVTGKDFTTVMKRPHDPDPAVRDAPDGPDAATSTTAAGTPTTTAKGATTTTAKGATTTTAKGGAGTSTTTTKSWAENNDGSPTVGIVPGEPPPGITCE